MPIFQRPPRILKGLLLSLAGLCLALAAQGQEEEKERNWALNGYVKDMVTLNFPGDSVMVDNLVHNRLNWRWYPSEHWTVGVDLRTRLFVGHTVSLLPNYGELVDGNNDYLDLSVLPINEEDVVLHSMIDRLYVRWSKGDWEVTAGRQRINWGVNTVWNPNDLFNVYNFFDFDYEERPGTDAIRVVHYNGYAASQELAVSVSDDFDETVMAYLHKWNKKGYDFQVLAGKMREDLALGVGWAGNIGNAGFKGEASFLQPYKENGKEAALVGSATADYSWQNGFYLMGSVMVNSAGEWKPNLLAFNNLNAGRLTIRDLSPSLVTTLVSTAYPINPLVNANMSAIYYPGNNGLFVGPGFTFSLANNLDLDAIGQLYWDTYAGEYRNLARVGYLRLKWSF